MFELMNFPFTRDFSDLWNEADRRFYRENEKTVLPFRADILDKGDRYELIAELPGFAKEDISINFKENSLIIHAEKKDTAGENDRYISRERRFGVYERTFRTEGFEPENITAKYENGLLRLDFMKPEEKKPADRMIEIR